MRTLQIFTLLILISFTIRTYAQNSKSETADSNGKSSGKDLDQEVKRALAAADQAFKLADRTFRAAENVISTFEVTASATELSGAAGGYASGGALTDAQIQTNNRWINRARVKAAQVLSDIRDNNMYKLTGIGLETSVASYNVMRDIKNMGNNMEAFWKRVQGDNVTMKDFLGVTFASATLDQYIDDQYQRTQSRKFNMLTWYEDQTSNWRNASGDISVENMLKSAGTDGVTMDKFLSRISQLEHERTATVTSACRVEIQSLEDFAANLEKSANSQQRMLLGRSFARNENLMAVADAANKFKMNQKENIYKEITSSSDGEYSEKANDYMNEMKDAGEFDSFRDDLGKFKNGGISSTSTKESGISSLINNAYQHGDNLLMLFSGELEKKDGAKMPTPDQMKAIEATVASFRAQARENRERAAQLRAECLVSDRINQLTATSTILLQSAGESNIAKGLGF